MTLRSGQSPRPGNDPPFRARWQPLRVGVVAGRWSLVAGLLSGALCAVVAAQEGTIGGYPPDEALELGERMYREGLLPSGEPMRAFVSEDIEVDGTMFSCESCHLRSGMGSIEGTVITYPTCGSWLFKPLQGAEMKPLSQERVPDRLDPPPFRPSYTASTLSRAIRLGRDPNGRTLNYVMPRYSLSSADTEVLIHYLKNLSAEFSPGVDDTTLRFATVVSHDVDPEDREAMVATLEAHVRDHNSQSRHEERRARGGPFYKEEKYAPYRRYALSVWQLDGAPETWGDQLEAHYREEPVFALLGGIATGEWAPIHEFCERNRIPNLFPLTEYPVISDTDWYTLYLDKGHYKEGETAARYIRRSDAIPVDAPVVQVFRDEPSARMCVRGFADARSKMRLTAAGEVELGADDAADAQLWRRLAEEHPGAVFALWLGEDILTMLGELSSADPPPPAVFVSASLVGDGLGSLAKEARPFTYITHSASIPADEERTRLAVKRWLQARKVPEINFDLQSKMYFLGWTLAGMVKMMRDDFYRDYFFDIADMMRDQYYSIAVYPRLSFGPGQRYASKGCYVVQLTEDGTLEKVSNWVVH